MVLLSGGVVVLAAGIMGIAHLYEKYSAPTPIVQKQVVAGPQAEIYIERDGVKYYSHVDGKSIEELVKENWWAGDE